MLFSNRLPAPQYSYLTTHAAITRANHVLDPGRLLATNADTVSAADVRPGTTSAEHEKHPPHRRLGSRALWNDSAMTQPAATIIASCIALSAALLAFIGVIVNNWNQNRMERDRAKRETAERRRLERIELFVEVLADIDQVQTIFVYSANFGKRGNWPMKEYDDTVPTKLLIEAVRKALTTSFKLQLLGFPERSADVAAFTKVVHDEFRTLPSEKGVEGTADAVTRMNNARDQVADGLRSEIPSVEREREHEPSA